MNEHQVAFWEWAALQEENELALSLCNLTGRATMTPLKEFFPTERKKEGEMNLGPKLHGGAQTWYAQGPGFISNTKTINHLLKEMKEKKR